MYFKQVWAEKPPFKYLQPIAKRLQPLKTTCCKAKTTPRLGGGGGGFQCCRYDVLRRIADYCKCTANFYIDLQVKYISSSTSAYSMEKPLKKGLLAYMEAKHPLNGARR